MVVAAGIQARDAVDRVGRVDRAEGRRHLQADAVLVEDRGSELQLRPKSLEVGAHRADPVDAHRGGHGELAAGDERGGVAAEGHQVRFSRTLP